MNNSLQILDNNKYDDYKARIQIHKEHINPFVSLPPYVHLLVLWTCNRHIVRPLATWFRPGEIGLMGRPCTHESLGGKQGKPGGLVVQTLEAKCGDRERARRAPRASQTRTACAPRTSQMRTVGEPDTHRARIVKALGPWSGAEGYFGDLN